VRACVRACACMHVHVVYVGMYVTLFLLPAQASRAPVTVYLACLVTTA